MRVRLGPQVSAFLRGLAPEPQKMLRRALRDLRRGSGDIRPLEGPLQDYCRLRVGPYRVLFSYGKGGTIDCILAERRSIIYELFAQELVERLLRGEERGR